MTNASWKDLDILGRRNNKIIKYMDTLLFKTKKDDPDTIVHYATAIGNLSRQNIELIKIVDRYEEINEHYSEIEKQKKTREQQARKWRRQVDEDNRIEFENEKHREETEIHEEKVARNRNKEMRL